MNREIMKILRHCIFCLIIAVCILSGCTKQKGEAPRVTLHERETVFSFTENFPVAEVRHPLLKIDFSGTMVEEYLFSGWSDLCVAKSGQRFCWNDAPCGVISIPIVGINRKEISLKLLAHRTPDERVKNPLASYDWPEQSIKMYWNEHYLDTADLGKGKKRISFTVPEEYQHYGPNYLYFYPKYWDKLYSQNPQSVGPTTPEVGFAFFGMEVRHAQSPVPIAPSPPGVNENSVIHFPGYVITYHFILPARATLKGVCSLKGSGRLPSGTEGKTIVSIRDSEGTERIVFSRDLASMIAQPQVSLDEDISSFSGKAVSVSLSFYLELPAAAAQEQFPSIIIEWENLRISGKEKQPQIQDMPQLKKKYNVIIVLFDALRADHTEPYSSDGIHTPHLERLASHGVTFSNAIANTSWTRTSVASLLTSLHPSSHKVETRKHSLPDDVPYLPDILQSNGYQTSLILENGQVAGKFGFERGIDNLVEVFRIEGHKEAEDPVDFLWENAVKPTLKKVKDNPFFIFLHTMNPHDPYTPVSPYDTMYYPDYKGNLDGSNPVLRLIQWGSMKVEHDDLRYINSLYRGEISHMDTLLGRILDTLKSDGIIDNTLVIFVSDHGEEFLEHGSLMHFKTLYEEVLRVPLIMSLKGVLPEDRHLQIPVQLTDVAPTILDVLGVETPPSMQGRSLLPYFFLPEEYIDGHPLVTELKEPPWDQYGVRYGNWKLIGRKDRTAQFRRWELYNLKEDSLEQVNRISENVLIAKALQHMIKWQLMKNQQITFTAKPEITKEQIDPKLLENLKALGYVD